MPKIMTVYGTRPEAIKVAPLIKALEADERLQSIAVSTGQHREMLDQVNAMFGITPKIDLSIMRPGQTLNGIVSRVIGELDSVLDSVAPDAVVVHGDTSTAMAAAIAAFNREIPVVHLEAGLRTETLMSPFPEEANRRLISRVSSLNLAPTSAARTNLLRESVAEDSIVVTGNTVIDALFEASTWDTQFSDSRLQEIAESGQPMVLVTTHRRENISTMAAIGSAMRRLALSYPGIAFVLPAHLNPKVRAAVFPHIEGLSNVIVSEPLPYNEFTKLMSIARIVLTDSGGVQEEAPGLGKPVLVMRKNTERPEALEAGTVRLVGTDEDRIVIETSQLLDDEIAYATMANAVNPYGDGVAANRAVAAIAELVGVGQRVADYA
ncbi:non-hydrolyzing UDP-N-acetylglucosamine 2-epimerase [Gulosibacter sp. ACHW.36C]|uniref:UDP-N-acetylglucosamine 2-epimerase (non-hydrolyzing) n=1 Tax=Gulosibacter sediminis TaxID=1729695 RepID=A0ABY4N3G9_9MICO|nr:UDP-N-acetylglucosamine 2-epimerase (non-hydrolyzing) [Gulosibacter sediminis]UQN16058.1 UDP-N-acetylglucosamine 2-epimerase (non-hydrolyzing) [Gulosibacter sediminis]